MKLGNFELDEQQKEIVLDESENLLVIAGAGSGKTLTIIAKIKYLVENKNINPNEILCISFTKEATISLKNKIEKEINQKIDVYTFHKLSLNILNNKYNISDENMLDMIIDEFFKIDVFNSKIVFNKLLKYLNLKNRRQYDEFIIYNKKELEQLQKLVKIFIKLFKTNNYQLEDFIKFKRKIISFNIVRYMKEKDLLILILNIYLKYETYLKDNDEIDFDDMLIKAIEKLTIYKKTKYIIIDEYQDTSFLRFKLIQKLKKITGSKLVVVGDDFQSIYRFTGCDIDLFLNFRKYFKNAKILKIEKTYRNSNELIKIAGSFVMKNKNQIRKNLKSDKKIDFPVNIVYYNDKKIVLEKLIEHIYNETKLPILVLGRNNKDIYEYVNLDNFEIKNDNIIYKSNLNIKIRYLTVHKSKGLEEENVIVLNMIDKIDGFPNKMKDDRILRLVTKYEKYKFAEERRLFYVALTRTRNKVYLLTEKNKESIFIKELFCQKSFKIKKFYDII